MVRKDEKGPEHPLPATNLSFRRFLNAGSQYVLVTADLTYPPVQLRRPAGVTILTILQIIAGITDILIGILLLAVYGLALEFIGITATLGFTIFLIPLSIIIFAFGVGSFFIAYGLWTGRGWAWTASVLVAAVGLAMSILGLFLGNLTDVIPIALDAIVLIYLSRYDVRLFFGRVRYQGPYGMFPPRQPSPPDPFGGPVTSQMPQAYLQGTSNYRSPWNTCIYCGKQVMFSANFCDRCGTRLR